MLEQKTQGLSFNQLSHLLDVVTEEHEVDTAKAQLGDDQEQIYHPPEDRSRGGGGLKGSRGRPDFRSHLRYRVAPGHPFAHDLADMTPTLRVLSESQFSFYK